MKTLLIGKTLGTGGTSRYTTNLVANLKIQKLDFDFINLKRFYDLPGKYKKRLDLVRKFPRKIDYDNYDLIHFLEFDYSLYGMLRHLGRRKERPKIIKTSHGMFKREEIFSGLLSKYVLKPFLCYAQKNVQRNVDAVIYVSDEERELFLKTFKLDLAKTYVMYLASSFETYKGSISDLIEHKDNTILFVGRVERRKNIEKIFEVARLLPDMSVKVVGHINDFKYYHELQEIKPINAEFIIDLPDSELITTYQRARYFVSFSRWESCPVTYLESISQGTPVIAYSMPIWKMSQNGCGYRVLTPDDCVTKIRELEKDYDSAIQRTINTADLFTWEKVAKETIQIYQQICNT